MAELLRQGTDLAWLARQHSIDGLKESGGDKGWIVPQRRFSALHDALFGAEPGAVLGPMGVPGNYTVVRVNAVEDQGHYSFEEAQGRARAGVADLKYQQTIDEFIRKLRSRSEITINEAILASMRITGAQVEEEAAPPGHGH
jgi:parvulin-like peptidyl-prolyl isomerase